MHVHVLAELVGHGMIGRRVNVYWPLDEAFYAGEVIGSIQEESSGKVCWNGVGAAVLQ